MNHLQVKAVALLLAVFVAGCAQPQSVAPPLESSQVEATPAAYNALRTRWN